MTKNKPFHEPLTEKQLEDAIKTLSNIRRYKKSEFIMTEDCADKLLKKKEYEKNNNNL